VPHLVRIHRTSGTVDWNTYAIVAIIEPARRKSNNPEMPMWLEEDYHHAIRELAEIGVPPARELGEDKNATTGALHGGCVKKS
jgi:hypothetical protein